MKRFLLAALLLPLACGPATPPPADPTAGYDLFGDAFSPEGAVAVAALTGGDVPRGAVVLEGRVSRVCQANGCWLTLQADPPVRIDVARDEAGDYRFTVPTDIDGRRVVVRGTLAEDDPAEDHDAEHHHAEDHDEGHDAEHHHAEDHDEGHDAPEVIRLVATGVLVEKARP